MKAKKLLALWNRISLNESRVTLWYLCIIISINFLWLQSTRSRTIIWNRLKIMDQLRKHSWLVQRVLFFFIIVKRIWNAECSCKIIQGSKQSCGMFGSAPTFFLLRYSVHYLWGCFFLFEFICTCIVFFFVNGKLW